MLPDPPAAPVAADYLVRLPVERPQAAVSLLLSQGGGVMDFIAHFWERLGQTPPLARNDLHLLLASPELPEISPLASAVGGGATTNGPAAAEAAALANLRCTGAMLFVPKAYRADVFAATPGAAKAFCQYILAQPRNGEASRASARTAAAPAAISVLAAADLPPADSSHRPAINFITGPEEGVAAMLPVLLPAVRRRSPAKQVVNVVMRLGDDAAAAACAQVRPVRESDAAALNRWRKMYKEERGILFDADVDAWIASNTVFVLEEEGQVVAAAKFDLVLPQTVEIGGVYTFPEHRNRGYGSSLVSDLVQRVREMGKQPVLQVDKNNAVAIHLYMSRGWRPLGYLSRVWLDDK